MGNQQRIPVHLIRQNGLWVEHVVERQDFIIWEGRILRLRERMEDDVPRLWQGSAQVQDRTHPDPSPLRHRRPSLNTIVLGDLLLLRERTKIRQGECQRPLHQSTDSYFAERMNLAACCTHDISVRMTFSFSSVVMLIPIFP